MGRTGSLFRYRKERRFPLPAEAIWPFVADTARLNELVGMAPYRVEERLDDNGRVRRIATGRFGPMRAKWQEGFGEWEENRYLLQRRDFETGPFGRFEFRCDILPEADGSRLVVSAEIECVGLTGWLAKRLGVITHEMNKRLAAIEGMIAEAEHGGLAGAGDRERIEAAAQRRLETLAEELARDPDSHGLTARLVDFLARAPAVSLRSIRPLTLARYWSATPESAIALCLAAQRRGILAMGWDLLCPRCRGAKARVTALHELPEGAHCDSCNIDYQRDFDSNVELTFHPEPWLRPLPAGELCLLGPATTPHVKFQAELPPRSSARFALVLPPGPYRFRTVEAGAAAEAEIGADAAIPEFQAEGGAIRLGPPGRPGELVVRNETDRPLFFVAEDRRWAADALTGDRVLALPAFRRLCPEQLLRPGDDAKIGRVAILFTDLQGSTALYETLGDARAYRLVRDHFAFLAGAVQRHNGVLVKTIGDAVMAAFHDPADAVRAALAIQDGVAGFNADRADAGIVLKLGLHAGPCIAVTTAEGLDYFGSTVNTASRLEHQCGGGEVLVSEAVLAEAAARTAIAGRSASRDAIVLRGLREPVGFCRLAPAPSPR